MLPINVNDLLEKNRVESNRIEFKEGWNPVRIYQSICAFANDIDNLGGGYILVGVKEDNGKVVRPVCGLTEEELRQRSHRPQDYYGQAHFMPSATDGEGILRLNRLRCVVRQAELAAVAAFSDREGLPTRPDILQAMNRIKYSLLINLMRQLLVLLPAMFLLFRFFGQTGVWLAFPVCEFITFLVALVLFRRQKFQ